MVSSSLIRWSGAAAMLGGVLFVVSDLLLLNVDYGGWAETLSMGSLTAYTIVSVLAAAFLQLGLVGLYARQSEATGVLGAVGFLLAFFGTAFTLGTSWAATLAMPTLVRAAPEVVVEDLPGWLMVSLTGAFSLFVVGWFLFAFATFRGRVYPQAAAALLMFGVVMLITHFALSGISGVFFGVAVAWLGLILLTGGDAPPRQPRRVR